MRLILPGKLQSMILGNNNSFKYSLMVNTINIKESGEVELLAINIDKAFNFRKLMPLWSVKSSRFKISQKVLNNR